MDDEAEEDNRSETELIRDPENKAKSKAKPTHKTVDYKKHSKTIETSDQIIANTSQTEKERLVNLWKEKTTASFYSDIIHLDYKVCYSFSVF